MKPILRRFLFLLPAAMLLAQANAPAKTSVAIYPIKAVGAVDKSIAATFTSLLSHELSQSPQLILIKESLLQEVMKRQAMNISDLCDDTVCQVEIGKLVQAQKMVVGDLSKLGARYYLTLDLIDIQSGAVQFSTREECACTEDQLVLLVAAAGAKIRNHFGEALAIPSLPVGQAFLPAQPSSPQGAQAFLPVQTSPAPPAATNWVPGHYTIQESHPAGTKGGPMVFVSDFKFYIDKYEVTNQDYQECVSAGVCWETKKVSGFDAPNQPVVFITQDEARTFCQWAGKRLPTEAEWQEAAQGTDGRTYPWGNQGPNCNLANYGDCKIGKTLLVGSKPAGVSPYGTLDMAGNVWEWVEEKGVVRGGSWGDGPADLRVSGRFLDVAWGRYLGIGFRCARD